MSPAGPVDGVHALLLGLDPADLRSAANGWRTLAQAVDEAGARHRTAVNGPLRHGWQGADADAAFRTMERTELLLDVVRVEAEAAALTLDTVAERMYQAQTNLVNAVRRAEDGGLPVSADGRVGPPAEPPALPAEYAELQARSAELQARIDAAHRAALDASEQGDRALARLDADILTAPRPFGPAAETATDAAAVVRELGLVETALPDGTDPAATAAWWAHLTPEQRRSRLALQPAELGRLDGLPAADRDRANRLVLDQRLDALQQGGPGTFGLTDAAYNERVAALKAIKLKLDQGDGDPPPHRLFLLGLDPEGDGRAVVATGDPDRARHTAVFVPGTGTVLAGVPGQIDHIRRLQGAAEATAPGEPVAVVSWLGYDAPEWGNGSVAGTGRGDAAAEPLRRFTAGLAAARGGAPGHTTVIGHSYGCYAVGAAARGGGGLHADEIVALAAPGLGVDRASGLQADPAHVWVGTARDDGIQAVAGTVFGAEPQSRPFGARRIEVDTSGHSGYWEPGSESLRNQGRIITGRPPTTVPDLPR
ncbi:alpha/beta hydrolase [Kitasatospora sp. NPDC094015]|uniref:alpha/beta hydrolase n=1 Tax=Kitasatospora sp. NPDC094015 TaxID=3155205 RepID=UPI003321EE64